MLETTLEVHETGDAVVLDALDDQSPQLMEELELGVAET